MSTTDVSEQMGRQLRRHFLTCLTATAGAAVVAGGSAALAHGLAVDPATKPTIVGLGFALGLCVLFAIGMRSAYRNLRCPACGISVWMRLRWNFSMSRARDARLCTSCGAILFGGSFRRLAQGLAIVALLLGVAAGVLMAVMRQ
jgi:hypothetical protein